MLSRLPATLRASSLMACSRNAAAAPAKRSVGVSIAGPDRLGNGPDDAASYRPEWLPHPLRNQTWVLLNYYRRSLAHSFRLVDRLTWLDSPPSFLQEPLWPLQLHSPLVQSLGILISTELSHLLAKSVPTPLRKKACTRRHIPGVTRAC